MIEFDKNKCLKCGKCIADCGTGVIAFGPDGFPAVADEKSCLKCRHCFAICPTGAVIFDGVDGNAVPKTGDFPETAKLENLMKSRRTVRKYRQDEVPREILERLARTLDFTPTGCNDHRLKIIFVSGRKCEEIRHNTNKTVLKLMHSVLGVLMPQRYKRFFKRIEEGEDVIFRGAPAFVVIAVHKDSPCKNDDPIIALTWFELLANSLGLGCCWCGFAQRAFRTFKKLRRMLDINGDYRIGGVMLFGYPDVKYIRQTDPDCFDVTYSS